MFYLTYIHAYRSFLFAVKSPRLCVLKCVILNYRGWKYLIMMVRQKETCKGTPYMGLQLVCIGERLMDCNSARVHCFSLSYRVDGERSYRFASVMGEDRNCIGYGVWCRVEWNIIHYLIYIWWRITKRNVEENWKHAIQAIQAPTWVSNTFFVSVSD